MTTEAQASTDPARAKDKADKGLSPLEKVFLGFFAALMLLAGFAFCTRFGSDLQVAPAAAAIAFGVGVATLFYTFFPGNEASFAMRGIRLTGAAALFGVVAYFGNGSLEHQFAARATRAASIVLPERAQFEMPSGATIKLEDVKASRGERDRMKTEEDAETVFAELLRHAHARPPPWPLAKITEEQWQVWMGKLTPEARDHVIGIPFARVLITSSDGATERRTYFKNDSIRVLDKAKRVEAELCVTRVFNVVEQQADEDDAVILTPGRCKSE